MLWAMAWLIKAVCAHVPDFIRYYLGENPSWGHSKHTCSRSDDHRYTLAHAGTVVKAVGIRRLWHVDRAGLG